MIKHHRSILSRLVLATALLATGLAMAEDKKPVGTVSLE